VGAAPSGKEPGGGSAVRTVVVWCADWPAVSLGRPAERPVAVVRANRVVSTNAAARAAGVTEGLRRREAQRRCPSVEVHERDPDREARAFEPVVAALDGVTPRVEIDRPGCVLFPARGPSRFFGGDVAMAGVVRDAVLGALERPVAVGVGVADGAFAAGWAARRSLARAGHPARAGRRGSVVVAPGDSAAFLADLPIGALAVEGPAAVGVTAERRELADVLVRLGIDRLGRLAALDAADVVARFGALGLAAHRVASGDDLRPPHLTEPPPDLEVSVEPDPPLDRVDAAAFVAKSLADELIARLAPRGLAAVAVLVSAELAGGRVVERRWRHEGALSPAAMAQRVRWQLDGWLTHQRRLDDGRGPDPGGGPIVRLVLRPEEVVPDAGRQLGFWGGDRAARDRALQGLARVQGLLGGDAVRMAEWCGGRAPAEQFRLVPLDALDLDDEGGGSGPAVAGPAPWPGRLPDPPPPLVWGRGPAVQVLDPAGGGVQVDGRGTASGVPAAVLVDAGPPRRVEGWAGPWVADERWWDPVAHRRRARLQVRLDDGSVHLLVLEAGHWRLEATWD